MNTRSHGDVRLRGPQWLALGILIVYLWTIRGLWCCAALWIDLVLTINHLQSLLTQYPTKSRSELNPLDHHAPSGLHVFMIEPWCWNRSSSEGCSLHVPIENASKSVVNRALLDQIWIFVRGYLRLYQRILKTSLFMSDYIISVWIESWPARQSWSCEPSPVGRILALLALVIAMAVTLVWLYCRKL